MSSSRSTNMPYDQRSHGGVNSTAAAAVQRYSRIDPEEKIESSYDDEEEEDAEDDYGEGGGEGLDVGDGDAPRRLSLGGTLRDHGGSPEDDFAAGAHLSHGNTFASMRSIDALGFGGSSGLSGLMSSLTTRLKAILPSLKAKGSPQASADQLVTEGSSSLEAFPSASSGLLTLRKASRIQVSVGPAKLIEWAAGALFVIGVGLLAVGVIMVKERSIVHDLLAGAVVLPGLKIGHAKCRDLSRANTAAHLVLNVISAAINMLSGQVQQLLTSITKSQLQAMEEKEWTQVTFGNNGASRLFGRGVTWLSRLGWVAMVLTSVSANVFINSIITYTTFQPDSAVGIIVQNRSTPIHGLSLVDLSSCADSNAVHDRTMWLINRTVLLNNSTTSTGNSYAGHAIYSEVATFGPPFSISQKPECHVAFGDMTCALTFRSPPAVIVGISIIVKCGFLLLLLWKDEHFREPAIHCIGDAILLLQEQDKVIRGRCLASWCDLTTDALDDPNPQPHEYRPLQRNRFQMMRLGDHIVYIYWLGSLGIAWGILAIILKSNDMSFHDMFRQGFFFGGTVITITSDAGSFAVLGAMFFANLPQLWLSSAYFTITSSLTQVYTEHEWQQHHQRRKLRRTFTTQARSYDTRKLQLPLRYFALAFLVGLVSHWFLSETLFVVSTAGSGVGTREQEAVQSAPLPLFGLLCLATTLFIVITSLFLWPRVHRLPILNNSLAVIAAVLDTDELIEGRIQWGQDSAMHWPGHCSLGRHRRTPTVGLMYGGKAG